MEAESGLSVHNTTQHPIPVSSTEVTDILRLITEGEQTAFSFIEIVFVDNDEIVRINKQHLGRDYITDIITFSYEDPGEPVEGTLYCSSERITEQADELGQELKQEYLRIITHGLLHLCGYTDGSTGDKEKMTQKEDHYLTLLNQRPIS